ETCNLPLMQTTGATVARLTAAGLPPDADCAQGRGTPSPDWVRAVETLVRWLAQYPTATVDLRDLSATLTSASPATAPALPAGFAVDLAAPAPVPTEAPEADTRILFTRHAGGSVTLSGATPDALTRDAIVSYAEGRFGAAKVTSMIGVRDGIPPRDTAQLLAALDLLALLDEGSVRAHNGALSLTGVGGTPDIPARVSEASADLPVTLDVRYRPRAEQRAARAATCAEDLTAAQTDARIQFAPSSTALTAESAAVLDAIATILRACDGQRFEIAGYTDNQGSESMNLTLSKARAEAVLDALLARDVFLDRMVAMGYGEADPIADNDTEEGRSRNRRIEFRPLTEGE
ncbi:MAG: OmpA family protein, partial [Pseudomonadota bacterium]